MTDDNMPDVQPDTRLYAVQITKLDRNGVKTDRQANGVLSLDQIKDPDAMAWLVYFAETQEHLKS